MIISKKIHVIKKQIGFKIRFAFLIGGLSFLMMACNNPSAQEQAPNLYFDLKEFIDAQVVLLDSLNPSLEKQIIPQNQKEGNKKTLNLENWSAEFKLFRDANINRAIYEGLYSETETQNPSGNFVTYQAQSDDLKTRKLVLNYNNAKELIQIRVETAQSNWLTQSTSSLHLYCQTSLEQGLRVKSYRVKGSQKTLFGTDTDYHIVGKIKW